MVDASRRSRLRRFSGSTDLREQVQRSWEKESEVRTQEDFAEIMQEQIPWHFADPRNPRIEEYERRSAGVRYAPDVLRVFAQAGYGGI
jgi:hypothetical protein